MASSIDTTGLDETQPPEGQATTAAVRSNFSDIKTNLETAKSEISTLQTADETLVQDKIHAAASKAPPVDADEFGLIDSAASWGLKKLTWANLKATLKAYYDSVVSTLTNKTINLTNNTLTGTIAEFNAAVSDKDFCTLTGTETLTNKTLTVPKIANIVFPSTQVPSADANTLDDYEEGTWTPTVGGTATYIVQSGRYTKVGGKVFVEGYLEINLIGTGDTTNISGLPFTTNFSSPIGTASIGWWSGLSLALVHLTATLGISGTSVNLRSSAAAASSLGGNPVLQNGSQLYFTAQYTV